MSFFLRASGSWIQTLRLVELVDCSINYATAAARTERTLSNKRSSLFIRGVSDAEKNEL
jgi:hypothetical protein